MSFEDSLGLFGVIFDIIGILLVVIIIALKFSRDKSRMAVSMKDNHRGASTTFSILLVCLILIGSGLGYFIGNKQGFQAGYNNGNVQGFADGSTQGNVDGYKTGLSDGKKVGYSDGFTAGKLQGTIEGITQGTKDGQKLGYSQGFNDANSSAYLEGFNKGKESGYQTGYSIAYDLGNRTGFDAGYTLGYKQAIEETQLAAQPNEYTTQSQTNTSPGNTQSTSTTLRDPTYSEMLSFLKSDPTDSQVYSSSFTCKEFSEMLVNDAAQVGLKAHWVVVQFPQVGHALDAFITSDKGLIFIEPQEDFIMNCTVGQVYWPRNIYQAPSYDDVIVKITIGP